MAFTFRLFCFCSLKEEVDDSSEQKAPDVKSGNVLVGSSIKSDSVSSTSCPVTISVTYFNANYSYLASIFRRLRTNPFRHQRYEIVDKGSSVRYACNCHRLDAMPPFFFTWWSRGRILRFRRVPLNYVPFT